MYSILLVLLFIYLYHIHLRAVFIYISICQLYTNYFILFFIELLLFLLNVSCLIYKIHIVKMVKELVECFAERSHACIYCVDIFKYGYILNMVLF